ncbi:ribonuclease E inhibitor RraB [Polymorphobacter arshaanensis]|uniref:Ribonuclease E inhibitor RraB n=1 Tax=Glacieibacterium arshaanense TaxID=2511025 RepID=A0A4Y9EP47_9SPHN|nr:ribonuclease E inhibitor RraB [Polymorphobacter arshaanensis]TFU03822.1 ribonuclease E inhibitor RraB [Polymorphobacter arshaanensis]
MSGIPEAPIDLMKFAMEIAADSDVLEDLAANGDIATLVRPIDVHFKGSEAAVQALRADVEALGFRFVGFGAYEDGDSAIDLQIDGTTQPDAMAALTRKALEIEVSHGVEYDGWGCEAKTGKNS